MSLVSREVSGGRPSPAELDAIASSRGHDAITLSGLAQDTFEYFVERYGHRFREIHFWKCPRVEDLRPLEMLKQVQCVSWFWNQRASQLWDLGRTPMLYNLSLNDFTRLHDLRELPRAKSLQDLEIGSMIWPKLVVESLGPLARCRQLRRLAFNAKRIGDDDIRPLAALQELRWLSFPSSQFSTEQVAWLKARLPTTVHCRLFNCVLHSDELMDSNFEGPDVLVVGKRKPFLYSDRHARRIERYQARFDAMVAWFRDHPGAGPDDVPGSLG